ncbi:MAG: DUF262 domain-containing protein [Undibacterium umbellatum]|uniref:DUF262 domain-containing protein n=1 Tax=Undibacterium umbellatum TaxID=2762300 RepID=UPI003BB63627
MIDYRVRSVSLLDFVSDVQNGKLIPDAYFQRNLVWREVHKRDFIETILLGYPFPQIFISKGKVNVELMTTVSCIVDGQQRCNAIMSFIAGEFLVKGKKFAELDEIEKANFLKYEIAVIALDVENTDPKVQEIFQRINRTSTSLSAIEKLASQYSTSEFMLVAKLLTDQISLDKSEEEDFRDDPNIPEDFYVWARKQKIKDFRKLFSEKGIYGPHEIARKTNLMHTLNMMSALLGGFSNRNEKSIDHLDDYALKFDLRDQIISRLETAAEFILSLGFKAKSYWLNKSNAFSLLVAIDALLSVDAKITPKGVRVALDEFEREMPPEYKFAATEAVNSTRSRQLRHDYLVTVLLASVPTESN